MSAYLNALREEGTRDDLLRQVEKLYRENQELRAQIKPASDQQIADLYRAVQIKVLEDIGINDAAGVLDGGQFVGGSIIGLTVSNALENAERTVEVAKEMGLIR